MTPQPGKLVFGDPASIAYRDREAELLGVARKGDLSSWRVASRPHIRKAIEDNRGKPIEDIRRAISAAYPFGVRRHHPYTMWLKEVHAQLDAYVASLEPPKRIDALLGDTEASA